MKYFTESNETNETISDKKEPIDEDKMIELALRKSLEEHRLYLDSLLDQERAIKIAIARSKDEMQWEISQKCMQKMHQDPDTTLAEKEKCSKNGNAKAKFQTTKNEEIPSTVLERQKYWKAQYEKLISQQKNKQAVKTINSKKLTAANETIVEDKENIRRLRIHQRIREEMFS